MAKREDILNWLKENEKKGYTKSQLRSILLDTGFNKNDVDDALKQLYKKSAEEKIKKTPAREETYSQFWDNLKYLITQPETLFARIKNESPKYAITAYILLTLAASILSSISGMFFRQYGFGFFSFFSFFGLLGLIFPILVLAISFIHASITHAIVRGMKGTKGTGNTIKVFCYSLLPFSLLSLIPFIGSFSLIYSYILMIIGIAKVHNITRGRAAVAVLLPPVFIIGSLAMFIIFLFFGPYRLWYS